MEIPTSGIVNRYIATQGPLTNTCDDFWQMIWEQKSALIIMVTPLVECGSIKCFKYWPDLNETQTLSNLLQLNCTKQIETSSLVEREFRLIRNGEERICTHLQYLAWPDHGVPDDPMQFLELIFKVRQYRCGLVEPIIVHCRYVAPALFSTDLTCFT
jgi:tyrosine-protein phosphatase non-receptor type 4